MTIRLRPSVEMVHKDVLNKLLYTRVLTKPFSSNFQRSLSQLPLFQYWCERNPDTEAQPTIPKI